MRLSVVTGSQRADLVVPGTVPVVELLPSLAARVGLLDPLTAPGGHRLLTAEGRELTGAAGLAAQGVADGALLTISAAAEPAPRVHDDVVAVVADVVEHDLAHQTVGATRRTTLASAAPLLALSALCLATAGGAVAAAGAGSLAAVLLAAAVATRRGVPAAGRLLGWLAVVHAAVAGALAAGDAAAAMVGAGAGAMVVGAVGAALVDRPVLLPALVAGSALAAAPLVSLLAGVPPAVSLTVAFALVVVGGDALPWLAATAAGLGTGPPLDAPPSPAGVDRGAVGSGVRRTHTLLASLIGAQGVVVVATVPAVVSLGRWGALVAGAGCALLLLRSRRHRVAPTGLVARWSATSGVLAGAAAAWWWHPDWRLWLAVALALGGGLAVAAAVLPPAGSLRLGRLGEVAEGVALASLPPLLVLATGVVDRVRELVP